MTKRKRPAGDCNTDGLMETEKVFHANDRSISQGKDLVKRKRRQMRMDEERAPKPGYWAVLPAVVRYDPQLRPSARLLYAEISSLTDQAGYCFASNAYFQRLFEISERTVIRLLRELEAAGYIRIEDRAGGKTQRKIFAGINPAAGLPVSTLTKMSPPPDKNVRVHNNKKYINTPQSPPGGESGKRRRKKAACDWEPEIFERFWKAYPRGEDKAAARYEWDNIRPDRKLMREMSAALDRQKQTDEWRRGVGIPYACRWLRDRRWEDETRAQETPEETDDREDVPWL